MKRPSLRYLKTAIPIALAFGLAMAASADQSAPLPTAPNVDLQRYAGRWYELARLPMFFQKADEAAIAEYAANADGTLAVHNRALRQDGSEHDIRGTAKVLNPPINTKLAVRFDTWFGPLIPVSKQGNYWILYVDADYRLALVGTPSRKSLWLLARTPKVPPEEFEALVARAKALGFEVSKLIRDPQLNESSVKPAAR